MVVRGGRFWNGEEERRLVIQFIDVRGFNEEKSKFRDEKLVKTNVALCLSENLGMDDGGAFVRIEADKAENHGR
ncbi:hypothetical protein C2S51_030134 [Perilla frutescens var. frutescens]|nr:hypothetical protein C2S51_030134 [Perilla frutescens var. frutescens]